MAMDFLPTAYIRCLSSRITVTTAATAVRCGSSNLAGRKWLVITNSSNVPLYFGSQYVDANTTTPTDITAYYLGKYGQKLAAGDSVWLPVSDTITIYARTNSGVKGIRVMELA